MLSTAGLSSASVVSSSLSCMSEASAASLSDASVFLALSRMSAPGGASCISGSLSSSSFESETTNSALLGTLFLL